MCAHFFDFFAIAALVKLGKNGMGGGAGKGASAEGGAVVSRAVYVCDFRPCGTGAHGYAACNALRHGEDVGNNVEELEGERCSAAEDARLYFVADHERVVFKGEASNGLHERFCHGMHAAFALNGLEHDRANVLAVFGEDALELVFVVRAAGEKAAGQGLEVILEAVLHGCGNRFKRASVEASSEADDGVGAFACAFLAKAGELHGAFVGLGARIGEKRLPGDFLPRCGFVGTFGAAGALVGKLVDELGHFGAMLYVEVVGNMQELSGLFLQRFREHGMVMAKAAYGNAGEEIEVGFTGGIGKLHARTLYEFDIVAGKGGHDVAVFELFYMGERLGWRIHGFLHSLESAIPDGAGGRSVVAGAALAKECMRAAQGRCFRAGRIQCWRIGPPGPMRLFQGCRWRTCTRQPALPR